MCNFHSDVAIEIATNPITGKIDHAAKALIRVALSQYWLERYIDGAKGVTGYNPYAMATKSQQRAFEHSGLKKPFDVLAQEDRHNLALLHGALARLKHHMPIDEKSLGLPRRMAQDAFLDYAIDHFYLGDPKAGLVLISETGRKDLKPLLKAVSEFKTILGDEAVLESLVQNRIARLYLQAPERVNQKLLDAYESLPMRVQEIGAKLSNYGGNLVLGGFSGLAGHAVHYGAVVGAGLASGAAGAMNIGASVVCIAAGHALWDRVFGGRYKSNQEKWVAFASQTAMAGVIGLGVHFTTAHDHGADDHMNHHRHAWFQSLPSDVQSQMTAQIGEKLNRLPANLRADFEAEARAQRLPPTIYYLICTGVTPAGKAVREYLMENQIVTGGVLPMRGATPNP
jgi:hypothetical protein